MVKIKSVRSISKQKSNPFGQFKSRIHFGQDYYLSNQPL
jgi:hypothetical protein